MKYFLIRENMNYPDIIFCSIQYQNIDSQVVSIPVIILKFSTRNYVFAINNINYNNVDYFCSFN